MHQVAVAGLSGTSHHLPFLGQVQRAFGRHRIDQVSSHQDAVAQQSAGTLGVAAFARGEHVVFRKAPDIQDVAHEAAHVIQQRSAKLAPGLVSQAGDRHERHADQVASAVSRGQSAEVLLDQYPPASRAETSSLQARGGVITEAPEGQVLPEFPGAEGAKAFSEQEKQWITEIISTPLMKLFFDSYETIPEVVLHRVRATGTANGRYNQAANAIALADPIYQGKTVHQQDGERFTETDQEAFKGTLVHELFHYLEHQAKTRIDGQLLPSDLVETLYTPEAAGFPKYAFGWFVHPDSDGILHFQLPEVMYVAGPTTILGHPELLEVRREGNWERSPMPKSGRSISPEEDLSESISRLFASERVHEAFKQSYPQRYKLLGMYVGNLLKIREQRASP